MRQMIFDKWSVFFTLLAIATVCFIFLPPFWGILAVLAAWRFAGKKIFFKWLFIQNSNLEKPRWWWIFLFSLVVIAICFVAFLPFLGILIEWDALGRAVKLNGEEVMVAYRSLVLPGVLAVYCFEGLLACVSVTIFFLYILGAAHHFAKGCLYIPPDGGFSRGYWYIPRKNKKFPRPTK